MCVCCPLSIYCLLSIHTVYILAIYCLQIGRYVAHLQSHTVVCHLDHCHQLRQPGASNRNKPSCAGSTQPHKVCARLPDSAGHVPIVPSQHTHALTTAFNESQVRITYGGGNTAKVHWIKCHHCKPCMRTPCCIVLRKKKKKSKVYTVRRS